ncbi:MAG TPA: hypothetical protein ENL04_03905, partial [Sulfuricurvum sp.]|nr:hypothetical protein [Sulfuricurvum sp.]
MKFDIFNHVAISAGAGSGKTYTLSRRYVNILLGFNLFSETLSQEVDFDRLDPCPPDRIVTITYTEAGALEMRGRIFSLVQKIIAYSGGKLDGEDNDYKSIDKAMRRFSADEKAMGHIVATLQDAIRRLPESVISTIHSYCLHLIDSYGDYIGMDASPSVIADDEKNVIFDEVYKNETNNQSKLVEEIDETVSFYKLSDVARKFCFDAGFRRAFSRYADDLKNETIDLRNIWLAMLLEEHLKDIAEGLDASREMAQLDERKRDYYDALLGNFEAVLGGETEFQPYKGQLRTTKKLPKALLDRVRKAKSAIDALKDTAVNTPS